MDEADRAPRSLYEAARLRIAHLKLDDSEGLWNASRNAVRVSATTLGVRRVGLWFLSANRLNLHRVLMYSEGVRVPEEPFLLQLHQWPGYLEAVLAHRVVAADDAATDPRTCELRASYLDPLGITSMLDVPIFLGGEVWGVVCHEHIGPARVWSPREIDFAVSVADMLSAMLEQSLRVGLEKAMRQGDHVAARTRHATVLARTAGGIGHDVNTVLQAISSAAEQARNAVDEEGRLAAIAAILDDCRRGSRIVNQLKDLEVPAEPVGAPVDLAFILAELEPTLLSLLGPSQVLVTDVARGALVSATRTDIERIILNLVVNARDAMVDRGTVTVRVRTTAREVALAVQDEGVGIALDACERVFEPFFTTKGDRHTGLGLFAVQTISERTGAVVSLSSAIDVGTTITVAWPAPPPEG